MLYEGIKNIMIISRFVGFANRIIRAIIIFYIKKDSSNFKDLSKYKVLVDEISLNSINKKIEEVILKLNNMLLEVQGAYCYYLNNKIRDEKMNRTEELIIIKKKTILANNFFLQNRILLNNKTCIIVETILKKMENTTVDLAVDSQITGYEKEYSKERNEVLQNARRTICEEDVPIALKELETEFRKILGIK